MVYVDLHVHIDFYSDPLKIANEYEKLKIYAIFVTYLPKIFLKTRKEYEKFKYIRIAVGFHPDMIGEYEFNNIEFNDGVKHTKYIGEVGLDFSNQNNEYVIKQIEAFDQITSPKYNKGRVYSIHSRKAETEVLRILIKNNVKTAIFHWFTGGKKVLRDIIDAGYYISVNYKMLTSKNGRDIIQSIPTSQLLFETDGPFARKNRKIVYPNDIQEIYRDFEKIIPDFENLVYLNFKKLLIQRGIDEID